MHRIGSRTHTCGQRLALATACTLLLLTSAPADRPNANALGTVLQVPLASLGAFVAQNSARRNHISLLHVSQTALGDLNSQVATVSVRQYNKSGKKLQPAKKIWLPTSSLVQDQETYSGPVGQAVQPALRGDPPASPARKRTARPVGGTSVVVNGKNGRNTQGERRDALPELWDGQSGAGQVLRGMRRHLAEPLSPVWRRQPAGG